MPVRFHWGGMLPVIELVLTLRARSPGNMVLFAGSTPLRPHGVSAQREQSGTLHSLGQGPGEVCEAPPGSLVQGSRSDPVMLGLSQKQSGAVVWPSSAAAAQHAQCLRGMDLGPAPSVSHRATASGHQPYSVVHERALTNGHQGPT